MDKGAYQIVLHIKKNTAIKIGALGEFDFPQGFYVYTGSAMRNLTKRVERHCKKDKKLRWHIDYLTSHKDVEIINAIAYPSENKMECLLNQNLHKHFTEIPVKRFGSSDCRECPAHLIYLGNEMHNIDNVRLLSVQA